MTSLSTSTPSQSKMMRSNGTFAAPAKLQPIWSGKIKPSPSGVVVIERDAIKLQPVIDQPVAELAGNLGLQLLDFLAGELDHLAVAQIDQVVVMAVAHLFVARAALAEIVPLNDSRVFEQLDGAVDGGDGNLVVDCDTTAIEFFHIGMIRGLRQHARDDAALLGHAHAGGCATRLDTGRLERG